MDWFNFKSRIAGKSLRRWSFAIELGGICLFCFVGGILIGMGSWFILAGIGVSAVGIAVSYALAKVTETLGYMAENVAIIAANTAKDPDADTGLGDDDFGFDYDDLEEDDGMPDISERLDILDNLLNEQVITDEEYIQKLHDMCCEDMKRQDLIHMANDIRGTNMDFEHRRLFYKLALRMGGDK